MNVVIGPWSQRPNDREALLAQIDKLERQQVARHAARDERMGELSQLIERKEQEIANLKGQL